MGEKNVPGDSVQVSGPKKASVLRVKLGSVLGYVGLAALAGTFGMVTGFYVADRGVRWFPTTFYVFLLTCVVALLVLVVAKVISGSAVKLTRRRMRLRKTVILCLSLAVVGIVIRLGGCWAEQASPLTTMSPEKFNAAFDDDLARYNEYDSGLERQLKLLQTRPKILDPNNPRALTADQEKFLRDIWTTVYDYAFALDQIRLFYEDWYRFDPSRAWRSYHLRSFLLTFAAELSLYEKSSRLVKLVTANRNAVKFLDTPCAPASLGENSFSRFRQQLQGARDGARVMAGRQYLLWLEKALKARRDAKALGCDPLWEKIELELAIIDAIAGAELAGLTVGSDMQLFKRAVRRVWFPAQRDIAEWMGNTRVQRIGTYLITPQLQTQMNRHLEPGDIMISRKNWYLSNVALPGFWPHAILYIGSPQKLQSCFDDPQVRTYLRQIAGQDLTLAQYLARKYPVRWQRYKLGRSGEPYRVIEAISTGVELNTLGRACGDYMAVLRPRLDKNAKAQAIIEAFSHLDKPYDYDFDFATDHALICTEVIWRSYRPAQNKKGLNLNLVDIAGRKTLPPNEIVKQFAQEHARDDRQFDFVYFLDASEKSDKAFVSTQEKFLQSHTRKKWSFALD